VTKTVLWHRWGRCELGINISHETTVMEKLIKNNLIVINRQSTSYRPAGGETICPPPVAADLRPFADGSAVRTSLVTGQLQAASVPPAACYSLGWDRQTDGSRYRLMPPPYSRGRNKSIVIDVYRHNYSVGQKTGLSLRVDNFATVMGRTACDTSKISKFCPEKL